MNRAPGEADRTRARIPRSLSAALLAATLIAGLLVGAPPAAAAPGDLDPTFGTGGKVTTDFGSEDGARALVVQADGKIVAVGSGAVGGTVGGVIDFALARYNADGTLDPTFDTDGKVTTDFEGRSDFATAVALQSDGKIVVAGFSYPADNNRDFALARYLPDGSLDEGFGTAGKVITDFLTVSDQAFGVALQPDGKIVAAGSTGGFGDVAFFALARYLPDGALDGSFGAGGLVTTNFTPNPEGAREVVIQPDGKIVAAGGIGIPFSPDPFALVRYNPNGTLDPSFDGDGMVTTFFTTVENSGGAADLALQPDGKIVAVGDQGAFGFSVFALARYHPDGSLDSSFAGDGTLLTGFRETSGATGVVIQSDGKIVAAGSSAAFGSPDSAFALARFTPDGTLDSSFSSDGWVLTDFLLPDPGSLADDAWDVALQSDGKIIVGGNTASATSTDFALARYLVDGAPPPETGTVTIVKNAVGGDETFSFTGSGDGVPASFTITTSAGTGSETLTDIPVGAKTVTELEPPSGWEFSGAVCEDPDNGTVVSGQTADIDLDAGEAVTCTFTNSTSAEGILTGVVRDGRGNPLANAAVELRDGETIVSGSVATDTEGSYVLLAPEGSFELRVTLRHARSQPTFMEVFYKQSNEATYAEFSAVVSGGAIQVTDVSFGDAASVVDTNVPVGLLEDLAYNYFQVERVLRFEEEALLVDRRSLANARFPGKETFKVVAFHQTGCDLSTCYRPNNHDLLITSLESTTSASGSPMNVQWHEASHELMDLAHPNVDEVFEEWERQGSVSHGGFANTSTTDSWIEGWADFWPLVIWDFYRARGEVEGPADLYRWDRRPRQWVNVEDNHKWWEAALRVPLRGSVPREEFAVAGVLWDLYDPTGEGDREFDRFFDQVQLGSTETERALTVWGKLNAAGPVINVRELWQALKAQSVGAVDPDGDGLDTLDDIFIMHGFFQDIAPTNRAYDTSEEVGWACNDREAQCPRP